VIVFALLSYIAVLVSCLVKIFLHSQNFVLCFNDSCFSFKLLKFRQQKLDIWKIRLFDCYNDITIPTIIVEYILDYS